MPTSHYRNIPDIIKALITLDPARILEIGVGMGKWGLLAREYLEIWGHLREPWGSQRILLHGIEAHAAYLTDATRATYDALFVGDALEVLPALPDDEAHRYDLVLMVDVLEHFTHDDGARLLALCAARAPRTLVCLPAKFCPTHAVWGNAYEVHRAAWTPEELEAFGTVTVHKHDLALLATIVHG